MIKAAQIQALASTLQNDLVSTRRHLHMHPELSFHEYETSAYVAARLTDMGIRFQEKVAGTGLVGIIEGKNNNNEQGHIKESIDQYGNQSQ